MMTETRTTHVLRVKSSTSRGRDTYGWIVARDNMTQDES